MPQRNQCDGPFVFICGRTWRGTPSSTAWRIRDRRSPSGLPSMGVAENTGAEKAFLAKSKRPWCLVIIRDSHGLLF